MDRRRVVGKLVLTFRELEDGITWTVDLNPVMLTKGARDNYKLALITAAVMDNLKKTLGYIDTIMHSKADIDRMHNEMMESTQGKPIPDVDKYQTKLPFNNEEG